MASLRKAAGAWTDLLEGTRQAFSAAGFGVFVALMAGWAMEPGRRTITAMIGAADPEGRRAHDAYHRFVRCGRWSMEALWRILVVRLVEALVPDGVVSLDVDDTLYKKTGRKVDGAGIFRDAVRSTRSRVVYALGLNLVVVTLRVAAPWGGCPIGLPVGMRLHRKGGPTTIDLAEAVLRQLAAWLPGRRFALCGDGAYATLIARRLERTTVTSRMRRDAAIYEAAPPRTGKRGRPRTKGARLPAPQALAAELKDRDFERVEFDCRGRAATALVWARRVLWYHVDKERLVTLVVVRDPEGACPDDFFVTDDTDVSGAAVVARYVGRWSIEVTIPRRKAVLGRRGPAVVEGRRPRAGRRVVVVALQRDLGLVHRDLWSRAHMDRSPLALEEVVERHPF